MNGYNLVRTNPIIISLASWLGAEIELKLFLAPPRKAFFGARERGSRRGSRSAHRCLAAPLPTVGEIAIL
jgi:hypothetical protein